MSGFSVDWLDLREPADSRARDASLLTQAKAWLLKGPEPIVVDLGAGTGSTFRAFANSGVSQSGPYSWRLIDQDTKLLAEARRRHGSCQSLETFELDLANTYGLPLTNARLVTASALFDLVSAPFIDSLATALQTHCRQQPLGLYAALIYDGNTQWTPAHPLDESVLAAFNRDQLRNKGFGPSLGPGACDYLELRLMEAGFSVSHAESPWILDSADKALIIELIEGIAAAVDHDPSLESGSLREWRTFRQANASQGGCIVGHRDLLALPPIPGD